MRHRLRIDMDLEDDLPRITAPDADCDDGRKWAAIGGCNVLNITRNGFSNSRVVVLPGDSYPIAAVSQMFAPSTHCTSSSRPAV